MNRKPAGNGKKNPSATGKKSPRAKAKRKPEPPRVKYCKIAFSISEKEKNELLRFCEKDGIALKALYKKAVRLYVEERSEQMRKEEELSENQLDLFKPIPYQTKLIF